MKFYWFPANLLIFHVHIIFSTIVSKQDSKLIRRLLSVSQSVPPLNRVITLTGVYSRVPRDLLDIYVELKADILEHDSNIFILIPSYPVAFTGFKFIILTWYFPHILDWGKGIHYNEVIMDTMASQITSLAIVYSTDYSGIDHLENIKALRHWPLCEAFTGDRWIPCTNGQ